MNSPDSGISSTDSTTFAERRRARLTVDLAALQGNYTHLKGLTGPAETAAVVKADAYGLGAAQIVPALFAAGCRSYFVATAGEGATIRGYLPDPQTTRIFVLHGLADGTPRDLLAAALTPVLSTEDEVCRLRDFSKSQNLILPAALHIDTGMNRLGLTMGALDAGLDLSGLDIQLVMSHLACADEPASPQNQRQAQRFAAARTRFPGARGSLANSAGVLLGADYHHDLVRPGIALYGGNPNADQTNPFRTVATLEAPILQIREVDAGETVGYGATYLVTRPTRIATLGIGYADGYLRQLGNKGRVIIGAYEAPVIGRVSMDLVTVDVTHIPRELARPGTYAELFGPSLALEEVAAAAGTANYEILTRLGQRLARRYLPPAPTERG